MRSDGAFEMFCPESIERRVAFAWRSTVPVTPDVRQLNLLTFDEPVSHTRLAGVTESSGEPTAVGPAAPIRLARHMSAMDSTGVFMVPPVAS
jgi:hypothetical protein